MPPYVPYVSLHVRSVFSLGRGTATLPALIAEAARYGHDALALTDRNNLYGAVPFTQACQASGVRPILGAEVDGPEGCLVLLVENATGYANLCRVLTARMLDPAFRLVSCLARHAAGLLALASDVPLLRALARVLPKGRLWAALPAPRPELFPSLVAAALDLGIEPVATGEVNGAGREEHRLHAVLTAIRENTLVERLEPADLVPREAYFKAPAAVNSIFRNHPRALANTRVLADRCRFVLRRERWIFPDPPVPPGETAVSHLRALCDAGVVRRYGRETPEARRRLERELAVIERLGFAPYFVVVGEIMRFAQNRGIASVGRGSGAGALTAYLLGITNVDPLRYRLYFERFLHEKRPDHPDLDIDLCWVRRDEVIDHVYATYGHDRVAMISTHNTYGPRSAFREAAKAYGIAHATVNRLSSGVPHAVDGPLRDALARSGRIRLDEAPWPRVVEAAQALLGFPRHLGLHPGGIVISDCPLDRYVPLQEATKGIVCTQFEMRAVEATGLVKIDLLGNRALSTIRETVELIEAHRGLRVDPDTLPHADAATADVLSGGETLGVFQMESPGMRNLNRMLRTGDLATTIAAVALIRPGPAASGMKERFVRRLRGEEAVTYLDPRLEPLLRETFGVPLYEEDVMCVAALVAGLSLEDGDVLRRAIAGSDAAERERLGGVFLKCAERRGYRPEVARALWEHLLQFGAFAFCKAHAAGYGVLAWQAGWLKAHYPVEFACAIQNHHAGMYDLRTHLEDARRRGVRVLLPDLNRSGDGFTVEAGAATVGQNGRGLRPHASPAIRFGSGSGDPALAVRIGLARVRGLSESTRRALLAARARRPFSGFEDFLVRVGPAHPEAEALVFAGALDFTRRTRPELLCVLASAYAEYRRRGRQAGGRSDLFADGTPEPVWPVPHLPEFSAKERLWLEWSALGLCVGRHPMAVFREEGRFPGAVSCRVAETRVGRRVRVAGILAARRTVPTKEGRSMQFVTLEDETGLVECTLFPDVYARLRGTVHALGPYVAEGRIEEQYGAPTLNVSRIALVPTLSPRGSEASPPVTADPDIDPGIRSPTRSAESTASPGATGPCA
jgi:DNA-directed DNA polymerase III PolC